MSYNVPTILIGLGGIGGQIANNIYNNIPEDRRDRVAIHAFDTDVNSIKQLEHLKESVTQTSSKRSVDEYINENNSVLSWFPDNQYLRRKTLTEGAGQIRSISRLAFHSAMEEGKLNKFWENINSIFPVQSDKNDYGIRVIIITSLVGGTGSGIFLQVAMYLREMLEKKFGVSSVLVRGAFLLPDILVRSNTLDKREWENVQANGYASLKELNAITLSSLGHWGQSEGVTIDLEYRPDQVDIQGRTTHAITEKQLPYDFCFIYDYENLKGQHLHSVSDYLDQVTRSIFLQLFSPISERHFSLEDNQILDIIGSKGLGRYCGSGVATLTYPHEDIVEYCALKWSLQGLNDSWLTLDKLYDEEKKRYEQDLRMGIVRDKPDRGQIFISQLNNIVKDEKTNIFFTNIYRQTKEDLGKGNFGPDKAISFINAIEERVEEVIQNDIDLKNAEANCHYDDGKLRMRNHIKNEVTQVESALKYYQEQIQKKIFENKTFITHQIIMQDYESASGTEGHKYRLNTWMLKKPEPLHPVATRYVLYQTQIELKKAITELRIKNSKLKKEIDRYERSYNRGNKDNFQTSLSRVDDALYSNIFTRGRKLKEFREEYMNLSTRHLNNLKQYRKSYLLELVYIAVEEEIKAMIKEWERLFANLKDTGETIAAEIDQRSTKFEENTDPTKSYILGAKAHQEKLWENVANSLDISSMPSEISEKIYLALYEQHCERKKGFFGYEKTIRIEEMYRDHVLNYCREELKNTFHEKLDFNVIRALHIEANFLGIQPELHIEKRIKELDQLASPFIPFNKDHREIKLWGIHPESEKIVTNSLKQELFNEKQISDGAYSKYELICYRAHYGLKLQDLDKFSDGKKLKRLAGAYYEAYQKRINKLNHGESTVTPHLDRNWHLPIYMPDINPNQTQIDNDNKDNALLLGIIYEWTKLVGEDGQDIYQYYGETSNRLILKLGEKVTKETYKLHEALGFNPTICEEIINRAAEMRKHDSSNKNSILEHDFIKGCSHLKLSSKGHLNNVLDLALSYELEDRNNPSLIEKGKRIRQVLLDLITAYFNGVYGNHQSNTSNQKAAEFILKLWDESSIRQKEDASTSIYNEWETLIKNYTNALKGNKKITS
ncbi:hypothetical protein CIB95_07795 [Lottiidibacillus patelloidae]|uniref:Phosphonate ABC transporter permease n=1 Tax=Lottiidibacillus patelloidae TaxID=2670334 RepID=A0A263BUJ3_9BACI|nr:tubulin-like doman-containing protein [Lottiidibacillus patelloidae]OZM57355.1 hypothetical protein CIB95_07795 [Lottiidibacillus patelloidae]